MFQDTRQIESLKNENERLLRYIEILERAVEAREEKILLLLDPVAYNQFKAQSRFGKIGATELSEQEKLEIKEQKEKRRNDMRELENLGIL